MEELQPFITEWTVSDNDSITLPVEGDPNFTVDYGDGTGEYKVTKNTDEDITHTYEKAGTYTIKIKGKCEKFEFGTINISKDKITRLVQWGSTGFTSVNFNECKNLAGTIPEPSENSLNDVTSLYYLFRHCTELTGTIPKNLFTNCPKVTNMADVFCNCKNLTGSIPENLFDNCTENTSFDYAFNGCSGLTGTIPEKLFANCSEVTNFSSTFRNCTKLTGNAPALWKRENVTSYSYCFTKCINLSNYSDIPDDWK